VTVAPWAALLRRIVVSSVLVAPWATLLQRADVS